MPDDTTGEVVAGFLQRLAAGDADGIAKMIATSVDWYVAGNPELPWTGRRTRRDEAADYFTTMWPYFALGESTTELDRVVVDGRDAVILATFHHVANTTGMPFTTPAAMHVRVVDGLIVKLHLYEDTWAVSEAFFPTRHDHSQ